MFYKYMTEGQRSEEALFVSKLTRAEWDAVTIPSELLRKGVFVEPEGYACFNCEEVSLELDYYAEDAKLILAITNNNSDDRIRLVFKYGNSFSSVIDWVVNHQKKLNTQSFAELLKKIYPKCEQVFLKGEDEKLYLIQTPEDAYANNFMDKVAD